MKDALSYQLEDWTHDVIEHVTIRLVSTQAITCLLVILEHWGQDDISGSRDVIGHVMT